MTEAWARRPELEAASLQRLLAALAAARDGDYTVRLPGSPDPLLDDIGGAFNALADRLSERAAARERFLPELAHELRTPLNSMLVLARLLAENPGGNLTPEQVEYAAVIHSAGSELLSVLSDLLDAGANPPPAPSGPAPGTGQRLLVVEAARGGMLTLLARGAVSGLPDSEGPVDVVTASGPEDVAAALAVGPAHCAVLDLGAGPDVVPAALDLLRGARVPVLAHARDDLTAARFSGPVARTAELVRSPGQLRERITWHLSPSAREAGASLDDLVRDTAVPRPASVPGGPAPVPAAEPAPANGGARGPSALHGKKVLVVDDDPRNVFAITSTLEHYGMTVLGSRDGRDGIDRLRNEPDTDLVLMDLMMPGMDGYTAISRIREMPEFSRLPIIAVTAHTMTGELAGGVPGADDCLPKPLDTDELLGRMARCLAS